MSDVTGPSRLGLRRRGVPTTESLDATNVPLNRRDIPVTAFDFRNGAFNVARRARLLFISAIGITAIAASVVFVEGVLIRLESRDIQRGIDNLVVERSQVAKSFGGLVGVEGVDEIDLIERDRELSDALTTAVNSKPDIVSLLIEVQRTAAANQVRITSFKVAAPEDTPAGETADNDKNNNGVPEDAPFSVEITASADSFDSIIAWADAVRRSSLLTDVTINQSRQATVLTGSFRSSEPPLASQAMLEDFGISLRPDVTVPTAQTPTPQPTDAEAAEGTTP